MWHKSSYSNSFSNCVEVNEDGAVVEVRDTKDRSGSVLKFSPAEWSAFVAAVKAGG